MAFLQFCPAGELPLGARLLACGCRGRDVRDLQLALKDAGYGLEADGFYGYITEAAVRRFQVRSGLAPDGVAGPETISRLAAFRSGSGHSFHRVRPGETAAGIAGLLGVEEEALRRWNGLRRNETVAPGRLLAVPRLALLLLPGEKPPASLAFTLAMGPRLDPFRPAWPAGAEEGGESLPLFAADEAAWREYLRHPARRREAAALGEFMRGRGIRAAAVEIPPRLWLDRRRLLDFLARLRGGPALCPLVTQPAGGLPRPDLPGLARLLPARLLFDPGAAAFDLRSFSRLLRRVCASIPPGRLLVVLRGGGFLAPARGPEEILPARAARAEAAAARARWVWDEAAGVLRAVPGGKEGPERRLSLLEERGLRLRMRLAARLGLAGAALGGLIGIALPRRNEVPWPGEFGVADNFLSAPHID